MRKTTDFAHKRVVILLHKTPRRILGAERIVLVYIDFTDPLPKYLLRDLLLHPVDSFLVNEMIRMQNDLDPCPFPVRSKSLDLRLGKIVLQIRFDLERGKYIKKSFHCK